MTITDVADSFQSFLLLVNNDMKCTKHVKGNIRVQTVNMSKVHFEMCTHKSIARRKSNKVCVDLWKIAIIPIHVRINSESVWITNIFSELCVKKFQSENKNEAPTLN